MAIVRCIDEQLRLLHQLQGTVSIDGIARMARVARPTVYLIFGSRAGLFEAVGADLQERGGFVNAVVITRE